MASVVYTHWHPLCQNTTSSIKPEVHNALHFRRRRTEPRTQVTCTKNFVKFENVFVEIYAIGHTNIQTKIQTRRSQYFASIQHQVIIAAVHSGPDWGALILDCSAEHGSYTVRSSTFTERHREVTKEKRSKCQGPSPAFVLSRASQSGDVMFSAPP